MNIGLQSQTNLDLNSSFPKRGNFTDLEFSFLTRKTGIISFIYLTRTFIVGKALSTNKKGPRIGTQ